MSSCIAQPKGVKPVDPDIAEQAIPGHGVPRSRPCNSGGPRYRGIRSRIKIRPGDELAALGKVCETLNFSRLALVTH